jgi:hypothetical protein
LHRAWPRCNAACGLPTGLGIDSGTGLISGTIDDEAAQDAPYAVMVTVSDGSVSRSRTFDWTVGAVALPPIADQSNLDGGSVSLAVSVNSQSGGISYSATGLPSGLSIDSSTGQITGTVSDTADTNSPYSVIVIASDGSASASQSFTWTIDPLVYVDPIDDQSSAAGDTISLQISASDAGNGTLSYSATGLPSGLSIDSTTGIISGTIAVGADSSSPYNVTVTASDGGSSASQTFSWNVCRVGLVNPVLESTVVGQSVSVALSGGDADSGTVSYSAAGLPDGLSLDDSTGIITGTPTAVGSFMVTVTASDSSGSASQTFAWHVTAGSLDAVADQTSTEGDSVSLTLHGAGTSGATLSYSASGLPDGLGIDSSSRVISGTLNPGTAADGPFSVTVTVSDGSNSTSQSFNWTVNPYVNLSYINDQAATEGTSFSLPVPATDAGALTLTYSADGLPDGLSIDTSTGAITGTPAAGDALNGPYGVTITASDGTYSSSQTFTLTVLPATAPAAPTLTSIALQGSQAGEGVLVQVQASDAAGYGLTYSATNLPGGLTIDPLTGLISGTIADDAVSGTAYDVTVTVTDGVGNSVSRDFAWVVDPSPVSVQLAALHPQEGVDAGAVTLATFTTPDVNSTADDFTATIDYGDGTSDQPDVVDAEVDGQAGSFSVTDDHVYAEVGTYTVIVTVTSDQGVTSVVTGTVTVSDAPLTLVGGFQRGATLDGPGQGEPLQLGVLRDANLNAIDEDFVVQVDLHNGGGWQYDGNLVSLGDGAFAVELGDFSAGSLPTHDQPGSFPIDFRVTDVDDATAEATSTVVVGQVEAGPPADLLATLLPDNMPSGLAPEDCTATVDWGDGQTTLATVAGTAFGEITVEGSHSYQQDSIDQGAYTVTVTVTTTGGATWSASTNVVVVRPTVEEFADNQVIPTSGQLSNVEVARFTEVDTADPASEFTAKVDWGDGTGVDSNTTIVADGNGTFHVVGTHTYAHPGWFHATVTIDQAWGEQLPVMVKVFNVFWEYFTSISGPAVVPGKSIYDYSVLIPVAVSAKKPVNPLFTIEDAIIVKQTRANAKVYGDFAWYTYDVELEFPGNPVEAKISVNYSLGGETVKVSKTVDVIEVKVTDPSKGAGVGDRLADAFDTRVQGKLRLKGWERGNRNDDLGRPSLWVGVTTQSGWAKDPFTVEWAASIELIGPHKDPQQGTNSIRVGFVQQGSYFPLRVIFPTFYLKASIEGKLYADGASEVLGNNLPWYDLQKASFTGQKLIDFQFAKNTLRANDTPYMPFPAKWALGAPGSEVGARLTEGHLDLSLFVGAGINGDNSHVWAEGAADKKWSVDYAGKFEYDEDGRLETFVPTADPGITIPNSWEDWDEAPVNLQQHLERMNSASDVLYSFPQEGWKAIKF